VQHWRDSVSLFEHAVRVNPTDRQARTNLGTALLDAGEVDLGVQELAAGFDLDPADPGTRRRLFLIFVRQGNASYRAGSRAAAIVFYRSAHAIAPDSATQHHLLARALLAQGRVAEGWNHLVTARDRDPTIAAVHARMAGILAGRGDGAGAVKSYRTALRLKPRDPNHASALAVLLATDPDPTVRDPEEAVRIAEDALRSAEPAHLGLVDSLAMAYAATGRFHEAARMADRAISLALARGLKDRALRIAARREQYRRGELEPVPSLPPHLWDAPGRRSRAR
jgi:Flp pilus assembly protein TadD